MSELRSVWHVSREYASIAEAGGIKDAVRGLAEAEVRAGLTVTVVMPLYGFARQRLLAEARRVASCSVALPDLETWSRLGDEQVQVMAIERSGVRLLLLDSPRYATKGSVYTWTEEEERQDPHRRLGTGHWDAHHMNLILVRGALEAAARLGETPSIFHCHDGHAGFLPAIVREDPRFRERFRASGAVLTIHNAGDGYHQEVWDPKVASVLTGLPPRVLARGILGGKADPLLLASCYARVNTVSESYAEELLAEDGPGLSGGLGSAYRRLGVRLVGITNGVDAAAWDPRHPERTGLPCRFDPESGELDGKRECRRALVQRIGRGTAAADLALPLFGFIGRLTRQKGVDVLQGAMRILASGGAAMASVVLGRGDAANEGMMRALERDLGDRLRFVAAYDQPLAMLIYASSDFILVPSAYEPCGLTDMHGQLMGALPVVHAVGGLRKVRDGETGFTYAAQTPAELAGAIRRCIEAGRDPALLASMRRQAFREVFELRSWDRVLREGYRPLYGTAMPEP